MTGSIVTRTLKDGTKRYDVVYRADNKQRWKTFNRRREAEKFLTSTVKEVQEGIYVHVRPRLIGEVFDRWLTHCLDVQTNQGTLKPSTAKSYRSMLKTHLRPAFQDYRSDRLSAEVMAEWVRARAEEIADGTISPKFYNNLVNFLHVVLKWARSRGQRYLSHDPMADVRRLPRQQIERDYLEPADVATLLEAADSPDDMIVYLAVYSGLRRGEVFGLQWPDVDEQRDQIRVQRSLYQGNLTRPKTTHSARTVDVPHRIVTMLQTYRETYPILDGQFIFRTATGTPLDPDNWYKRSFVPLVARAKLRAFGLHTLRHTYASLLINQGENIKYVSKQLGHASIQITADLYGHLFKETSVAAMNRLSMRIPAAHSGRQKGAA